MNRSFTDYLQRGRLQHCEKFSATGLERSFVPYYESQQRVRVRFSHGEEVTGTIGATTGWAPCFLLMRTARSIGSSWTINSGDRIVAVQHGRKYVKVVTDSEIRP